MNPKNSHIFGTLKSSQTRRAWIIWGRSPARDALSQGVELCQKEGDWRRYLGLFLVVVGLVVWAVGSLLHPGVPGGVVNFTDTQPSGQPVHFTVQTVGSIGFGAHPTWVSYLVKDPHTGKWIHDTSWEFPAHTVIDMTVDQYDSGSPLRNQEWGQVLGTIGDSATLNGKTFSVYNSYTGTGVGHTFAIPDAESQRPHGRREWQPVRRGTLSLQLAAQRRDVQLQDPRGR